MPSRLHFLLSAFLVGLAPAAALSCPNDPSSSAATPVAARACPQSHSASAAPALHPHPRAAEIAAFRPHAWRPVAFAVGTATLAGVVVSIDPVDGVMSVPAPGSLESALGVTPGEDLTPVSVLRRADGSVRVQLDERWESHAVATIGPDGKPHWTCVAGTQGAEQFMKHPFVPVVVAPVPAPEEK